MTISKRRLVFFITICSLTLAPAKKPPSPQLLAVCKAVFNITEELCSCELFTEPDGSPSPLCETDEQSVDGTLVNNRSVTLTYDRVPSQVYASITVVALIFAIPGNALVIAVSVARKQNVSNFRKMAAILAFADIIFAILEFIRVVPVFWTIRWIYGDALCKILSGTKLLGSNFGIGIIVLICVERFIAIVYPTLLEKSKCPLRALNIFIFILAVAVAVPVFVFVESVDITGRGDYRCETDEKNQEALLIQSWVQVAVFLIIPSLVIIILYSRIISQLKTSMKRNDTFRDGGLKKQRTRENVKIAHILIIMTLSFILLVTPYYLALLVLKHSDAKAASDLYYAMSWLHITFPLHTAVNPCIYSATSSSWRRDAKRMFCKRGSKGPTSTINKSMTMSASVISMSTINSKLE